MNPDHIFVMEVLLFRELEQAFRVFVSHLLQVESFPCSLGDNALEASDHRLWRFFPFLGQPDGSRRANLVAESQGFRAENAALRKDGNEIFLAAHDKRRDAGARKYARLKYRGEISSRFTNTRRSMSRDFSGLSLSSSSSLTVTYLPSRTSYPRVVSADSRSLPLSEE